MRPIAFGEKNLSLFKMLQRFVEIDPLRGKERRLDLERAIDDMHEHLGIRSVSRSISESVLRHIAMIKSQQVRCRNRFLRRF
jgi:hypothetical protein